MLVAQKVKEAEITEQDSLLLTRNLLRIAVFNISYIRGLFPEKFFNDKNVPALEMNIKKLMPMDAESRRLIDWMEKGVYDALQKKYLKTLLFCICESIDGPMIEEYSFSFSYSKSGTQEVSMNINRSGNKKQGGTFKCNSETEVTPAQMRSSACKMVRTLIQLMRTLDKMPEERTILMKLFYYDDATPADYEPPFFRGCTPEETHNHWTKNPLKMEVGNVNSKHFALALKVKSILDPCDDDGDDIHDNDVSFGDDSVQGDDSSDFDGEVNFSPDNQADQYRIALIEKKQLRKEGTSPEAGNSQQSDDTQDVTEDERQLSRVKDWIISCQIETLETSDVLANMPDISLVLIEEIMDKLVHDGVLIKTGRGSFGIRKQMEFEYEFHVKEEDDQVSPAGCKTPQGAGEDHMYMKALYYALRMEYVTVAKLQHKLEGEANRTIVRKLMDKMARDGFIETRSNRRLGKRVIHSDLTEKKLSEVRRVLEMDPVDEDLTQSHNKLDHTQPRKTMNNNLDGSTCGALHSIGSDLTRTRDKSYTNKNDLLRNLHIVPEKDVPTTPISKAAPVASRESMIPGNDKGRTNDDNLNGDDADNVVCSGRSTQEKRCRKLSMVREPILQYVKRQKSQAAC